MERLERGEASFWQYTVSTMVGIASLAVALFSLIPHGPNMITHIAISFLLVNSLWELVWRVSQGKESYWENFERYLGMNVLMSILFNGPSFLAIALYDKILSPILGWMGGDGRCRLLWLGGQSSPSFGWGQ